MSDQLLYQIALTQISGVGDKLAKTLIAHTGSAEAVFKEKKTALEKIPGIGKKGAASIVSQDVMSRAEDEVAFIEKEKIQALFFTDDDYPKRLKLCEDGPVLLYYKGNVNLNKRQVIAIVGTRNATTYGKEFCEQFIEDLKPFNPLIISGLAYGIDIHAHKQSLKNGIPTVGVMAHGHDRLYPSVHKSTAKEMLENGGLITEMMSGTNPDRENFPKRNRIVAGISDVLVVVEAAKRGGALITAEIANSYNREVFAVPGRLGDAFSEGCNNLIKINKAALLTGTSDLKYLLGWKDDFVKKEVQSQLFVELEGNEKKVYDLLNLEGKQEIDILCFKLKIPMNKVLQSLMSLELKGLVKNFPGKIYSVR